ncbi:MAG: hypothetical protein NTW96_05455 [Planctomycetia bacterium]|nr:hypothetical protein [Planctomycetia bacterium]
MSEVFSTAPLRPSDFAYLIGSDANQVASVFDLLAKKGVLQRTEMVECVRCETLMPSTAFHQAVEDEDDFECSHCGRVFSKLSTPITVYRMTARAASRPKPKAPEVDRPATSGEEPLGDRAQLVLIAMLDLGAIDSDTRRSTEEIAVKALGPGADANSLKAVISDLSTRHLIETKQGRTGGCWLSKIGQSRAMKLGDR